MYGGRHQDARTYTTAALLLVLLGKVSKYDGGGIGMTQEQSRPRLFDSGI
jgi:hypothetical protein